ncbi:unnamed protein product [Caretta caretta]
MSFTRCKAQAEEGGCGSLQSTSSAEPLQPSSDSAADKTQGTVSCFIFLPLSPGAAAGSRLGSCEALGV